MRVMLPQAKEFPGLKKVKEAKKYPPDFGFLASSSVENMFLLFYATQFVVLVIAALGN